jgi:hypothetical protein
MSEPIIFDYVSQVPVQDQAHGQDQGQSLIRLHSHLQFKPQFPN